MPPAPLGTFWKDNPDPLGGEVERDGLEHACYLRLAKEPLLERWGLLLGDGIHNLRCALDLAVYELAIRESGEDPPPSNESCSSPSRTAATSGHRPSGASNPSRATRSASFATRSRTRLGMTSP
jgi:hypothetical protein